MARTTAVLRAFRKAAGAALRRRCRALLMPDVPTIGIDDVVVAVRGEDLAGRGRGDGGTMLLVDVRASRESSVSMIPGAITRAEYERTREAHGDRLVVSYCTVGYRSARYTKQLIRRGVDAANLEGSILAWVGAGLPLTTPGGESTVRIHTWSRRIKAPPGYLQVVD